MPGFVYSSHGRVRGGSVSHVPVTSMDVFATVASLANLSLPTDRRFDGADMSDIIFKESIQPLHKFIYHYQGKSLLLSGGIL